MQVDQSLVDSHLVPVPGLGTFTTRAEGARGRVSGERRGGKAQDTYDFRVVIFKTLVGIRTGPLTRMSRSLARVIKSPQTAKDR